MVQPHPLKKKKIYDCFCITLFVILLLFPNFKVTIKVMIKFSTGTIQICQSYWYSIERLCKSHNHLQNSYYPAIPRGQTKKNISPCQIQKKQSSNSPTLQEHSLYFQGLTTQFQFLVRSTISQKSSFKIP